MIYIKLSRLMMLFIISGIMAFSCKSDRNKQPAGEILDEEADIMIERIEQIKKVYHLFPSPAEMLSIIDVDNLQYNGDILNPPVNKNNYIDTKSQTLNLGVYVTDLAYSSLFGRSQDIINYLETVRDIAEKIRVSGTVNEELVNRAKNNVNYIDSLFAISNEAFINMLFFCERNKMPNTIIMISAGAFVESLFLAVNMIEKYDASNYLVQHLAEQKYALDNLIAYAESMADDPNVSATLNQINPLIEIYNNLETAGGSMTIKREDTNKLVIGGGKKILLSEQDFLQLKETASLVRNSIVSKNI